MRTTIMITMTTELPVHPRMIGFALGAALLLMAAPAVAHALPPGANAICPVDPTEPAEARFAVEHEGETVYLCCGQCARQFRRAPTRYLALLAHLPRVDEPEREPVPAGAWEKLGRFHIVMVHFPVGLLLAGAVGEMLGMVRRRRWLRDGVRLCVWGGAIGAWVAVPLGWLLLGGDTAHDDTVTAVHRWIGTLVFFWAIGLVTVMEVARTRDRPIWQWSYRLMLLSGALLVGVTGHFGGMMVHGTEYLRW